MGKTAHLFHLWAQLGWPPWQVEKALGSGGVFKLWPLGKLWAAAKPQPLPNGRPVLRGARLGGTTGGPGVRAARAQLSAHRSGDSARLCLSELGCAERTFALEC